VTDAHPTEHGSFDDRAASWDDDTGHVTRARDVAAAIREAVPLTRELRVLEYGAGTGLLAEQLAPHVGPITVTDPSAGMRDVVAAKIAAGALPDATVVDLDLGRDRVPADRYDLVVTAMALHHVTAVAPVLAGFAELLAPGGTLCIADLDAEDGSFHAAAREAGEFHGHDGFDRDDLAAQLRDAGFGPTRFVTCHRMERDGRPYDVFLATTSRD
jgi:2-polyprenyl-3-methyl-5-hydroxy-6-metoxy-1,4-benzoquinol methylase